MLLIKPFENRSKNETWILCLALFFCLLHLSSSSSGFCASGRVYVYVYYEHIYLWTATQYTHVVLYEYEAKRKTQFMYHDVSIVSMKEKKQTWTRLLFAFVSDVRCIGAYALVVHMNVKLWAELSLVHWWFFFLPSSVLTGRWCIHSCCCC